MLILRDPLRRRRPYKRIAGVIPASLPVPLPLQGGYFPLMLTKLRVSFLKEPALQLLFPESALDFQPQALFQQSSA